MANQSSSKGLKSNNSVVRAWLDDPGSGGAPDGGTLITSPTPDLASAPFPTTIQSDGSSPPPDVYSQGTAGFRYWAAACALRRTGDFWGKLLPEQAWNPAVGEALPIVLDDGADLNAYYDRQGLKFFHAVVGGRTVYSGESPDIVCHEFGHAVLDAIRPQLWDVAAFEAPAFHESFGDMSALLTALQMSQIRQAVLEETGGALYRSSRLSRLAEQLGWAIRQEDTTAVDGDCLRNAVNRIVYMKPSDLPTRAPATGLASEPHSFSRIFTGAFFEALSIAFESAPAHDDATLAQTSITMAELLLAAIAKAPVVTSYFAQVGAQLVAAANAKGEIFGNAVRTAMVHHGVLSAPGLAVIANTPPAEGAAAAAAPASNLVEVDGSALGFTTKIKLHVARGVHHYAVAGAATSRGDVAHSDPTEEGQEFLEDLIRRGRLDNGGHAHAFAGVSHPNIPKTHRLEKIHDSVVLKRIRIDCGLRCSSHTN